MMYFSQLGLLPSSRGKSKVFRFAQCCGNTVFKKVRAEICGCWMPLWSNMGKTMSNLGNTCNWTKVHPVGISSERAAAIGDFFD